MSVLSLQQADIFRLLQSGNTRWLIRGINLLLVVWIASLLASLTWDLVTPRANGEVEHVELSPLPVASDPGEQLIRQLPSWHLLGEVAKKQAPVIVETPINAPDTRLKLVLHGVFASEITGKARAIIADPKGKEEQYAVGDMLPGNAELSEVYTDRVILKRNGRFETLRLIQDSPSARTRATSSPGKTLAANQQRRIRDIRRRIQQNPQTLLEIVRPRPYRGAGNVMTGYTLQPGREPELFADLGLQAGDVAIQINDVRLDSTASGMQALKSIQSGDTASMTILRDGQEQVLSLRMP